MVIDHETDDKAVQCVEQRRAVVNLDDTAMSVKEVVALVNRIQEVMKAVMRDGEHFGTIPGCKHPSLYKSGAEKLSVTFRLIPSYQITRTDLPNSHREYEVLCSLTHGPSGQVFGQGVGSCSTMEAKYRFRAGGDVEWTGKPVPKAYWDDPARDKKHLGGNGFIAKKNPDTEKWEIAIRGERVEHDNPADYFNTVLKMAKKRAHVDAILTATAASDIFTQDVEDYAENGMAPQPESPPPPAGGGASRGKTQEAAQQKKPAAADKEGPPGTAKQETDKTYQELLTRGSWLMKHGTLPQLVAFFNENTKALNAIPDRKVRDDFITRLRNRISQMRDEQQAA